MLRLRTLLRLRAHGGAAFFPLRCRSQQQLTIPTPTNQPHTTNKQAANALTYDELQSLTYLQVKGSGLANTCPVLSGGSTNLKDLKAGSYKLERFCMEPTAFQVKEDSQFKGGETNFVKTKLMTRLTYTLDGVRVVAVVVVVVGVVALQRAMWLKGCMRALLGARRALKASSPLS
jgi:hypothetical protein